MAANTGIYVSSSRYLLPAAESPGVLPLVAVQQVDQLPVVLATPDERLVVRQVWLAILLQEGTGTQGGAGHLHIEP